MLDPSHSEVHLQRPPHDDLEGARHLRHEERHADRPREPARGRRSTASVDAASIDTKDEGRDSTCARPTSSTSRTTRPSTSVSTGVRIEGDDFLVDGDLTIRGITKPVTFEFEFGGFGTDPWGNYKAGATAKTVINREDFGLTWNAALETGGVLVGKDVTITLDLQGALQA